MSPVLRGGLIAASFAGAFAAGYLLKPQLAPIDAGTPPAVAPVAAPKGVPVSAWNKGEPVVVVEQRPTVHVPEVRLPDAPTSSVAPPVDLNDPGLFMVKNALNIKTTILDKSEPPLPVLASGQTGGNPPSLVPMPTLPLVEAPPVPMTGPMPRLDVPPSVGISVPSPPAKLVNTRAIALDFEITKAGVSQVSAVELWTTRDGGQTWAKTDEMAGCQSPFRTRLGSEGDYGFRLVFVSESGMRTSEPASGKQPDLNVILDTTPPKIELMPLQSIPDQPGKIRVAWKLSDRHMAHPSIRLHFSTDGRTWLPMDAVIANGYADWTMPAGLPHQVMIRLTARDDAGNEATAYLPNRVSIDLVVPQGKLTGIRPASGQEVGPTPRVVTSPSADEKRQVFSFYLGLFGE
ncbi:MAG TPA: hypothetical protein VHR66_09255 [Gemmataceae bacterium]|jgi:hypothetical protein|nr:hypothetical protein [Gemmataceae bacterium]